MNIATRILEQGVETRTRSLHISKYGLWMVILVTAVLCSALAVVYVKDLNRRLFIYYQTLEREKAEELIQWGRLLLEQSTWSTQSRIQQVAQQQLKMRLPLEKEVVLVKGNDVDAVDR